ncbi:hypothetical protein K8R32_04845 [bacterium]|nr:hypothetical protein [bacterium]
MPDINKNKQIKKEKEKKFFLLSWLNKIKFGRSGNKQSRETNDNFKKNKDDLADYHEVVNEEKEARNPITASDPEYSVPAGTDKAEERSWKGALKRLPLGRYTWQGEESAPVLKTNLIKYEVTTFIDWNKNLKILGLNILITLAVLGFLFGGLLFWEIKAKEKEIKIDSDINELAVKIKRMKIQTATVDEFQDQLNLVTKILDQHIYWTNFFDFLEKHTLPEVTYTKGFSGGTDGIYDLSAEAGSYELIALQIKAFKKSEYVDEVLVTKGTFTPGTDLGGAEKVQFNIQLKIKPSIFSSDYK